MTTLARALVPQDMKGQNMPDDLIREIAAKELTSLVQSTRPVLVTFCAPWYASCAVTKAMLERLEGRFAGGVEMVSVDIEKNKEVADEYAVYGVATIWLFAGGRARGCVIGAGGETMLAVLIESCH